MKTRNGIWFGIVWLLTLFVVLSATGCAQYGAAIEKAESAVDEAVQVSMRVICLRMTKRAYLELCAGRPELCAAQDAMCAAWYGNYSMPVLPENVIFREPARFE